MPEDKDDQSSSEAPAQERQAATTTPPVRSGSSAEGAGRTPVKPASDKDPDRRRAWLMAAVVIALLLALGVAGYYAYSTYTARRLAVERLDKATTLVEQADAVVLEVDEIVRTPVESSIGERAKAASETVPTAQDDLEEAASLISQSLPHLAEEHIADAEALRESAEARVEMLEHATPILGATVKAATAVPLALEGWDLIIEAQGLTDQAIKEYNKLDDASVKKSKTLTSEAQQKVEEAKKSFQAAAAAYPEADFVPFIAYADAKIAALALSIKGADALLSDQPSNANSISDQYNEAEKKLVAQAKALPPSPAEPIRIAFVAEIGEATELYNAARARATESDAQLQLDSEE
jgi:hypothetical protein